MTAQWGTILMSDNVKFFTFNIIELSFSRGVRSGVIPDTLLVEVLSGKCFSLYEVDRVSCIPRRWLFYLPERNICHQPFTFPVEHAL